MYIKWIIAVVLIGLCLALFSFFYFSAGPLKGVSSFKVYYGESNNDIIEQLGTLDMAIIEPHEYTKKQVSKLTKSKTITLGYISILELEKWNEGFVGKVGDSDYYYVNKEKVYVPDWDTYIMDISNPHYRQLIMEEIEEEIVSKGFQGIFLDTAGDIDDYFHDKPEDQKILRKGYIELVKEINEKHSDLILMQNWGFDTYKAVSHPYIDGILWENFDEKKLKESEWGQNWIRYFKEERVNVFTISPDENGRKYSEELGFPSFVNKNSIYNEWQ